MFPLGTVLVPGAFLPLRVFEPRYQALVHDCLEGGREFGVALIERGHEVGGGDSRFDVGCVARILQVGQLGGGQLALATVGDRRIQVQSWLPDDPYPRAEVDDWPDPSPDEGDDQRADALTAELRRLLALAAELGESVAPASELEPASDALATSYRLTAMAPVGPLDRYRLLAAADVRRRLDLLEMLLTDVSAVLASRLAGG
jgi:Lon protease-like protein